MRRQTLPTAAGLAMAAFAIAGPCLGADAPAAAEAPPAGVIVLGPAGPLVMSPDDIAQLPAIHIEAAFDTEHGPRQSAFEGPLLWTVLDHAHAIDVSKPRGFVRQTVLLTGRDGYTAILALGELAPQFESKQVILAEREDGKPLGPDHLRIIVPGDHRGGRSVHDLASIAVVAPLPDKP